ncbi:MAG TPA: hypothetical protein PLW77_06735 [Bacteroidales bacterium]|nr:hypothetical protein [Bacteroidales bacterium]HQB22636.1 hypothetical protein [Bacteroidales bacterium]
MNKIFIVFVFFAASMLGVVSSTVAQQKVDVKTLFNLLPSDAFMLLPSDKPADLEKHIKHCDYKNGYLSLEFENYGSWEMCYWNLKNGDKLVGTSGFGAWAFYLFSNGKMSSTTKFGIEEMRNSAETSIATNIFDNWINCYLPRYGTSVCLTINGLEMHVYKWQNEKFVRQYDYPNQNSTEQQLAEGFAKALVLADVDLCLQYILPYYVSEQCMGVFEGDKERFICDLIAGENEKGFVKPEKLSDIKQAIYHYATNDGFSAHTIFIELKNGNSYIIYLSIETIKIFEMLEYGEQGELLRATPYITGNVG